MFNNVKVLLVGTGPMAVAYAEVLKSLKVDITVVGRGQESASAFQRLVEIEPVTGGIENFANSFDHSLYSHAIVSTGVECLASTTKQLLKARIPKILIEKPGALDFQELSSLYQKVSDSDTEVYLGYNRRFYSSVEKAKELVKKDGGVTSMHFEFTEWAHKIEPIKKAPGVKENWFLANSTHVVDLAFYLGGKPQEMCSFTHGSLSWHPVAIFSGAGVSETGSLFTYHANWLSAGRWQIHLSTNEGTYYLLPLEELWFQKKGTVERIQVHFDNKVDLQFKPGLYKQVEQFLCNQSGVLCSIHEHMKNAKFYQKMLEQ